jgi:hypothetical protein
LPAGETEQTAWWGLAVELGDREWRAYQHYRECAAVNWQVPDASDPLVRYHASLFAAAERDADFARQLSFWRPLLTRPKEL